MKNCLTFIPALCTLVIILSSKVSAIQDMCTNNGQQDAGKAIVNGDYLLVYSSFYTDYLGTKDTIGCSKANIVFKDPTFTFTFNAVVKDGDGKLVKYIFVFTLDSSGTSVIVHRKGEKDGVYRNIYTVLQFVDSCTIALTLCSEPDPPTTDKDVRQYHWLFLLNTKTCGDTNVATAIQALKDRNIPIDDMQAVSCKK